MLLWIRIKLAAAGSKFHAIFFIFSASVNLFVSMMNFYIRMRGVLLQFWCHIYPGSFRACLLKKVFDFTIGACHLGLKTTFLSVNTVTVRWIWDYVVVKSKKLAAAGTKFYERIAVAGLHSSSGVETNAELNRCSWWHLMHDLFCF